MRFSKAMHTYLDGGGRVLAGHYQYAWFKESPYADFRAVASWSEREPPVLFTFDTPLGAPKERLRGRVAFSDLHVMDAAGPRSSIAACPISPGALDPAQRALEYTVFDLTSALGH